MQAIQGIYDGKMIRPLEPVHAHPNARVLITFMEVGPAEKPPVTRLQDVAGCLRYTGPAKTLSEMEEAIQKGIAEQRK